MRFPYPSFLAAALCSSILPATGWADFELKDKPGDSLDVLRDGKVVARWMYAHDISTPVRRTETYKPYLHVFDAAGQAPITKGPGGEFPHHRAIFLGWNKIGVGGKSYDRWHMAGGDQVQEKFLSQKAGKEQATFTALIKWEGSKPDEAILEDERTITFLTPPAGAYAFIDVTSKVKALAGETVLDGDPEHSGLQYRPAAEVDRTKTTYLYPVANANPHKDLDYPWIGESYTLDGKRYSVVELQHPENPKGGRSSAYRDYGRFGVFWKTTVPAGGTVQVRTRFLIAEGELPTPEAIQKLWNEFAGKNEPVPATTAKPAEKSAPPAPKKPAATPAAAAAPTGVNGPKGETGALAAATSPAAPTAPATTASPAAAGAKEPEYTGPKRAGGGPTNPVIKFPLPPPAPLSPEEALKAIKVPPGFKVELVASEPMIETPTAISWDDQGRMYVCEMRSYMHDVDGGGEDQPISRISRLEDTDGDGKMDKATVFVDKLTMPRAVMALGDGVVVSEPPNLIWYHDTDGDGVADKKEIITDRYATQGGQPEHMANSPTWMQDNWISSANYGTRFRYRHGQFEKEETTSFGQWGLTQDDWGRRYTNTNSDLLRVDLVPPAYYLRNPRIVTQSGLRFQVIKDQSVWPSHPTPGVNRGYLEPTKKADGTMDKGTLREDGTLRSVTGTCGPSIYRGDLFPKEFQGNAFIPEPCGNLVKRVILADNNNGEVVGRNAYEGSEFLTSTDERFRPVNTYSGPDGALYVVDIARGVIQHKGFLTYYLVKNIQDRKLETPFNQGRIYRIVPEGPRPKVMRMPKETAEIAPLLTHPNGWVRDTAQRVLVERGDKSVVPVLQKLAATSGRPQTRVQALWTLEGLEGLTPAVVNAALADKSDKVRVAGVRLADTKATPELLKLAADPSSEVRLNLTFKLAGNPEAEPTLVKLLESGGSMFGEAVATGMAGKELEAIEELLKLPPADDAKLAKSGILTTLAECVMKERKAPRVSRLLDAIAAQPAGGPRQLALLTGLAGRTAPKNVKGGTIANPLKFPVAPPSLALLNTQADAKAKPLLARFDLQVAWTGKPGWVESKVVPLTAEEQLLFEKGKAIYTTICGACHQPNGAGMAGLAPPLANSEWAQGPADRIIRIVTQGLSGPIEVSGTQWALEMPGLPIFTDEEVAGILTYIRREWENTASPVKPAYVTSIRAAIKDRQKPWTAPELLKPVEIKTAEDQAAAVK